MKTDPITVIVTVSEEPRGWRVKHYPSTGFLLEFARSVSGKDAIIEWIKTRCQERQWNMVVNDPFAKDKPDSAAEPKPMR